MAIRVCSPNKHSRAFALISFDMPIKYFAFVFAFSFSFSRFRRKSLYCDVSVFEKYRFQNSLPLEFTRVFTSLGYLQYTFFACRFCFTNTDHVKIPRRFELLLCSLKRPRASMKMYNFERKYYPGYRHMICFGKTKSTSEKRSI